ncbi:MAG: KTSC domain-containing protein [Lysobacter sp.]
MERVRVDSEALRSIGYDVGTKVLEIEFASRTVYRYFDVPDYLHLGLMAADSHGQFYADFIRNAGFDYVQVN